MKLHPTTKRLLAGLAIAFFGFTAQAQDKISDFTSLEPTGQGNTLDFPESHNFQLLFKQGETYTVQNDIVANNTVPGNHDFTGYVPIDGSSTLGYVSVNHENNPGGVSILDVSFNSTTQLWSVDASEAVDFYDENLVTTIRNCSGGVTPMGTVITAEESSSDDSNGDGYLDVGWLVEIDPETKQVMDYDGDGKKDKLWAMGKMNHENVVISNDGTVAYYGEDGGTQCLYKFVPDTAFDFTEGDLFVMQADLSILPVNDGDVNTPTATWIQVPNDTKEERNNVRDTARALGGTNFDGVEDCEISTADGHVYVASKGHSRVYRFRDNGADVSDLEVFVGGAQTIYTLNTESGPLATAWANGNDNLTIDNEGNVWVLQDGGQNYIWVVGVNHTQTIPDVRIFSRTPSGAEPTGLTFTPDNKYGFYSIQHPAPANASQEDASGNVVALDASATVVFALTENIGDNNVLSTSENSLSGVAVYPNPTQGLLNISLGNSVEAVTVNITDLLGRTVHTIQEQSVSNGTLGIDMTGLAQGTFIVKVTANGATSVHQVVKAE